MLRDTGDQPVLQVNCNTIGNQQSSPMKKQLSVIVAFTVLSLCTYSQIVFEEGYFIDESDQKINCLIKNVDWKNNPGEFEYRLPQINEVQKAGIQSVKEFGVNGFSKYVRADVQIDRSGFEQTNLNAEKNPVFREETLFLEVLVEGKASLYIYRDGNLVRFFYRLDDSEITQLVYKRYLLESTIARNNYFRQQLFVALKCPGLTSGDFESADYDSKDLYKLFVRFNDCTNSAQVRYMPDQKKDLFNLTIRPGLNLSKLVISNQSDDSWQTAFGTEPSFRFGVEAELIMPFNKNKWSIIAEPTFQYYRSETTTELDNMPVIELNARAKYQSIELPLGIRHYFFLNEKSKIFINASYLFDFSMNSSIVFLRSNGSTYNALEIIPRRNLGFGAGYKHEDTFSLEVRYQTGRNLFSDYMYWHSEYRTLSVILGYSFF